MAFVESDGPDRGAGGNIGSPLGRDGGRPVPQETSVYSSGNGDDHRPFKARKIRVERRKRTCSKANRGAQ